MRGAARAADDQLPQRAGHPGLRQRRVRAGHDRRCVHAAGRLRAAVAVPGRHDRGSRRWSRCRCRSRTAGASLGDGDRGVAARRRRRLHRLARQRERMEGHRAAGRQAGPSRGAARLHPVPPLHQLRRRRDDAVRAGARGARRPARPRRRQDVPRPRRGRNAPRRAGGDRVARRRAVGVRDAARSLFAIGDEELLDWKQRFRAFHPFRISPDAPSDRFAHLQPIVDAPRSCCKRLHRRRNYIPVADTIQQLLNATRAHVGAGAAAGGEQALANVLHVAELARQYEANGGISFRGFVEELRSRPSGAGRGSADPRGGQRRRPHDDRAQGEGAGVSRSSSSPT